MKRRVAAATVGLLGLLVLGVEVLAAVIILAFVIGLIGI